MNKLIKSALGLINKGEKRSIKAKKNILASFAIKGLSILVGFFLVPLTLGYLDQTRYGIWITLSSFLTWFSFFEVGLGKGLRNKLAEAWAKGQTEKAKTLVSTTYAILTIIIVGVAVVFFSINAFIDWSKILNTAESMKAELYLISLIVFGCFFVRFILKLLSNILFADQRPALANAFGPASNLISLIAIFILTKTTDGSLLYLALVMSLAPIVVFFFASILFYSKEYKEIRPSIASIDFAYSKQLAGLGIKFFIISIGKIIKYQTANIIIAQYFGPAEVTPYSIAFKYFGYLNMGFAIIISPFWSAFTEAWTKKDVPWIKRTMKRLQQIWLALSVFGIFMLIISNWFYGIWVGKEIVIPFRLSVIMCAYNILLIYGAIFSQFVNGVSKIKIQLYSSIIGAAIFFPLAFLFIKTLNFGPEGIILATLITNWYGPIFGPIQYKKIINNKAKGIWNQ